MMKTIAVLGMGAMGSRMAHRLLKSGYKVVVYSRDNTRAQELIDAGATRAATPAKAAIGADVVISMVTDVPASRSVWLDPVDGAMQGIKPGAVAIESSTLQPSWVKELALIAERKGVAFLDAPVVGSRPQADAGELIFLVGGPQGCVDRVRDVFLPMGGKIMHTGDVGSATVVKLAANALFAMQVATLAELMGFIEARGINLQGVVSVLSELPVSSPVARNIMAQMLASNFQPMFPVELALKDLQYLQQTAEECGVHGMPLIKAGEAVFNTAIRQGHGQENISAVAQVYRRSATPRAA